MGGNANICIPLHVWRCEWYPIYLFKVGNPMKYTGKWNPYICTPKLLEYLGQEAYSKFKICWNVLKFISEKNSWLWKILDHSSAYFKMLGILSWLFHRFIIFINQICPRFHQIAVKLATGYILASSQENLASRFAIRVDSDRPVQLQK